MHRRRFLLMSLAGALASPRTGQGQPKVGQLYRVGVLWLNSLEADPHLLDAFRQGLRDFVALDERNIVIEFRSAKGNADKLQGLVDELIRLKVDVIVADVTPAIRAAMRGTSSVPIVMAIAADPVGSGLVSSLAQPGGNVTGLSLMLPEISAKRLQLLKEVSPRVTRVAVLWHPDIPWHTPMLKAIDAALPALGLQTLPIAVRGPDEFEDAFSTMTRAQFGPGDLPVEQPTKFELVINLKTAKALGLAIPRSLLAQAEQIIE